MSETTIQRSPKNASNRYFVASQKLVRDSRLSFECRGVLLYLLSMRDDWKITPVQIWKENQSTIGRDSVYKIINEAISYGYLIKDEYYEENLLRVRYLLVEEPDPTPTPQEPEKEQKSHKSLRIYPAPEFQEPEKPDPAPYIKEVPCEEISLSFSLSSSQPYTEEEEERFGKLMRERNGREIANVEKYKQTVIESWRKREGEKKEKEVKREERKDEKEELKAKRKVEAKRFEDLELADGFRVRAWSDTIEIKSEHGVSRESYLISDHAWRDLMLYLGNKVNPQKAKAYYT